MHFWHFKFWIQSLLFLYSEIFFPVVNVQKGARDLFFLSGPITSTRNFSLVHIQTPFLIILSVIDIPIPNTTSTSIITTIHITTTTKSIIDTTEFQLLTGQVNYGKYFFSTDKIGSVFGVSNDTMIYSAISVYYSNYKIGFVIFLRFLKILSFCIILRLPRVFMFVSTQKSPLL